MKVLGIVIWLAAVLCIAWIIGSAVSAEHDAWYRTVKERRRRRFRQRQLQKQIGGSRDK